VDAAPELGLDEVGLRVLDVLAAEKVTGHEEKLDLLGHHVARAQVEQVHGRDLDMALRTAFAEVDGLPDAGLGEVAAGREVELRQEGGLPGGHEAAEELGRGRLVAVLEVVRLVDFQG